MAVISKKSFSVDNQKARQNKGPLIRIELQPGRFVKMYEQDAIEAGHIKPKAKPQPPQHSRPPQENKMREPEENKEAETAVTEPDDFATIQGVGPATVRQLVVHGITTFDELREADLDFLSDRPKQAIEDWIANG